MKRNEKSLQNWKLYYEAEKKLDITQAIFISNSLMARLASRVSKFVHHLVRARVDGSK